MIRRAGFAFICLLALAACDTGRGAPSWAPPGSPSFKTGYIDGCWTGWGVAAKPSFENAYYKDEGRFLSDPEYKRGWIEGQNDCYQQQMSSPQMG